MVKIGINFEELKKELLPPFQILQVFGYKGTLLPLKKLEYKNMALF